MAMSTTSGKPADKAAKSAEKDPAEPDTTLASETAAQAVVDASPLVPDADRVAMVSRDKNGNPNQSENFTVISVGDDAEDRVRDAAYNKPGEQLGAKHVKGER